MAVINILFENSLCVLDNTKSNINPIHYNIFSTSVLLTLASIKSNYNDALCER